MKIKHFYHLKSEDWIRNFLFSWLIAAALEFLLLPDTLKDLEGMSGIAQMSFPRLITLALCIFITIIGVNYCCASAKALRYVGFIAFLLFASAGLCASFHWAFLCGCVLLALLFAVYSFWGWDSSHEPQANSQRGWTLFHWITVILCIFVFLFICFWTVGRVYCFSAPTYDFGIFSQMFYYMKTTGLPLTTLERDGLLSHFAVHISPIYYLLLPFYCLCPTPAFLQVLQAAVVTSLSIPLWLICKQYGLAPHIRMLVCAAGLLYPALSGGTGYDIHENCFLAPLLLWLLYGLKGRKKLIIIISAIMVLLVKEDAAMYVAVIGMYQSVCAFIRKTDTRRTDLLIGLSLLFCAVVWFLAVTKYLSSKGDGVMTYRYSNFMPGPEDSLIHVVISVILNPMKVIYECLDAEKLPFLAQMLLPLLGLPLITRRYERYILLIPFILVNLMSDYPYQHDIFFQYTFGSTAMLLYLTAVNLADIPFPSVRILTAICTLLVCCVFFFSVIFPVGYRYGSYSIQYTDHYSQIREALSLIPDDASVSASTFYTTYLSQREILYDLDYCSHEHILQSDYVVISLQGQKKLDSIISILSSAGYTKISQFADILIIYKSP